jgi:hypothetical protein
MRKPNLTTKKLILENTNEGRVKPDLTPKTPSHQGKSALISESITNFLSRFLGALASWR